MIHGVCAPSKLGPVGCAGPLTGRASWWLASLAVGGISLVILSPRTVETESDGSLQAACCRFPGLETDELSVENKTPASGVPRNEGLWDETITSYVTAGIPGLRALASCG